MVNDQIKKLVLEKIDQLIPLLRYIKDHEMKEKGAYKEIITDYMLEQRLSSRLTTLNMINTLLQEQILLEEKIMNYRTKLKVNENYDFNNLLSEVLKSEYQKLQPLQQFSSNKKTFTAKDIIKAWQAYPIEKKVKSVQIS